MFKELAVSGIASFTIIACLLVPGSREPNPENAQAADPAQVHTAPTKVILVRHADRAGKADELTDAGRARAAELVHVLEMVEIEAVYHSEMSRTAATAAPICEKLGLKATAIPAQDVTKLVEEIRAKHSGKCVLVVGHSNTVPQIAKALGAPEFTIADDDFDDLFVVEFGTDPKSPATCLHLQYGAKTP